MGVLGRLVRGGFLGRTGRTCTANESRTIPDCVGLRMRALIKRGTLDGLLSARLSRTLPAAAASATSGARHKETASYRTRLPPPLTSLLESWAGRAGFTAIYVHVVENATDSFNSG